MAYAGGQTRIDILVTAIDQASAKLRTIGRSTDEVKTSFKDLAVGLSGVTTAAFSLYMSFDRIHKSQVSLDRANLMVQRSTESLDQITKNYNETVAKYGFKSAEAADALDKLKIAQESLTVAYERQQLAQEDVGQTMLMFAVSIVPTVITAVTSLTTALKAMGIGLSAALGPIGIVAGAITTLTLVVNSAADALREEYKQIYASRTEFDKLKQAIGELDIQFQTLQKGVDDLAYSLSPEGKMVAAYKEFYELVKEDNKLWSDTAGQLRNDFKLLQAAGSEALQKIALEFDKALTGGNIDKATWVLLDFAETFGISIDDARKTIDNFLASLEQIPSVVEEISTQITEAIDPVAALFDQLQSHWNLDKARELGDKYVEAYAKAWKSGMMVSVMTAAKKFATDMNISLEESVNILDELMAKLADTAKTGEAAAEPLYTWNREARSWEWANAEKALEIEQAVRGSMPSWPSAPIGGGSSVIVEINAPLVNVEGAADLQTARMCAQLIKDALKNVVIEATSVSAPTGQSQIRLGSSTTSSMTRSVGGLYNWNRYGKMGGPQP